MKKILIIIALSNLHILNECAGQSWIYDRCIRSEDQQISMITAYIIPCSGDTIISEIISLDTNSYVRQIEKYNDQGQITSSSAPLSHLPKSTHTKVYNYNQNTLTSIVESVDGVEQRNIKYIESNNQLKHIVYEYLIDSISLTNAIEYDTILGNTVEYHYQITGTDTTAYTEILFNEDKKPIRSTYYSNNKIHTTFSQRNNQNHIKNTISVNPNGRVINTEYRELTFAEKQANLNAVAIEPHVSSLYLEQYDTNGNVIRHIIINNDNKCLTTWYYEIEYRQSLIKP